MNKHFFLLFVGVFFIQIADSQTRLLRVADQKFNDLAYSKAIPYYLKVWEKNQDSRVTLRLAECYRLIKDYENANRWLEKAIELPVVPPETYFFYGHTLMQQNRFVEAKQKFETFSILSPDDPRGKNYMKAIDLIEGLLRDSLRSSVENLKFNSAESEFGALPYLNGLLFSSSRFEGPVVVHQFDWLEKPFLDIYYVEKSDNEKKEWKDLKLLTGEINSRFHESSITFFPDSNRILFSRNNFNNKVKGKSKEGVIMLKIYEAKWNDLEVSEVKEVSFNNENYSVTHPCLSPDGSIVFFTSNMPGGYGGTDLYKCNNVGGTWGQPVNLGPDYNTPGNEAFPFIHKDGTFYFSSDGHPGLGAMDLYEVRMKDGQPFIQNLGYPLNSAFDDFSLWINETRESGYMSSNRLNGVGDDDIYSFSILRPLVEIWVEDSIAKLPIEGAKIFVRNFRFNTTEEFKTDLEGRISFKTDFGEEFSAVIKTEEFEPRQLKIHTKPESGQMVFSYYVRLYNPPPAITALVIDEITKLTIPNARIELVKMLTQDTIRRISDHNGRFAVKLEKNTYYKLTVRAKGFLTFTDKFSTSVDGFDGDTIIPMKLGKIPFNQPIVLENILYDFDKWTIRADAYNSLIYLGNLLKDNPNIIVELGSHTDSRGSDSYNLQLSQKRATAARIFLLDMGVEANRIIAKGYGETKPMNRCRNGINCSDEEHFKNRRTEFKIIGTIEGVDLEKSILNTEEKYKSQPKESKVEPVKYPNEELEGDFDPTDEQILAENMIDPRLKVLSLSEDEKIEITLIWFFVRLGIMGN